VGKTEWTEVVRPFCGGTRSSQCGNQRHEEGQRKTWYLKLLSLLLIENVHTYFNIINMLKKHHRRVSLFFIICFADVSRDETQQGMKQNNPNNLPFGLSLYVHA